MTEQQQPDALMMQNIAECDRFLEKLGELRRKSGHYAPLELNAYQRALQRVFSLSHYPPLTTDWVCGLHRELYWYMPDIGGRFKVKSNRLVDRLPDGSLGTVLVTVPPEATAAAMESLHETLAHHWQVGSIHPLHLAGVYSFDFFLIHPFMDGHGRMVALLLHYLLLQAGFRGSRMMDIRQLVSTSREAYYQSLETSRHSCDGWMSHQHRYEPWIDYLSALLLRGYEAIPNLTPELRKEQREIAALSQSPAPMPPKFRLFTLPQESASSVPKGE